MPAKPITRSIDANFAKYAESHQNPTNNLISWICVPLIAFGLFGMVWAIPFPYLAFLGEYNKSVNWATFLIGFSGYYSYRLSPVLTYAMILMFFIFVAVIAGLESLHTNYGMPEMREVCLLLFILASIGQFIGYKIEGKAPSFMDNLKFLLIGPLWLLSLIFKKFKIPY